MATEGTGKHCARDLGPGWKISPSVVIPPGETCTMADIRGMGLIQHIWLTPAGIPWRNAILRFTWDDRNSPAVECPLGDFFASGWGVYAPVTSLPVCVNPGSAFNCYWEMPFRTRCRITIENRDEQPLRLYYQITYALTEIPQDCAYFHAQFRMAAPLPYQQPFTLLDGVTGQGHYVGTALCWGTHHNGWWGEGEIKFYLDDDRDYPTLCGTGTEDYFCGSYNFENQQTHRYQTFTTPYSGLSYVSQPDGLYRSQQRFAMYRWHLTDPIRFHSRLRVTIQALGWRSGGRYLPLRDDLASVAFWYQTLPAAPFPELPGKDELEII